MSRGRHVGLERAETAVSRGRGYGTLSRRAEVEEELAAALAAGDRQRVSELRQVLDGLQRGRTACASWPLKWLRALRAARGKVGRGHSTPPTPWTPSRPSAARDAERL